MQVDTAFVSSLRASLEALPPHASAEALPVALASILDADASSLQGTLEALALHTLPDEVRPPRGECGIAHLNGHLMRRRVPSLHS